MNVPGRVPVVWSSPRLITMNRGRVSFFSNSRNSRMNVSALSVSRARPPPDFGDAVIGAHVTDQARHGRPPSGTSRRAG